MLQNCLLLILQFLLKIAEFSRRQILAYILSQQKSMYIKMYIWHSYAQEMTIIMITLQANDYKDLLQASHHEVAIILN